MLAGATLSTVATSSRRANSPVCIWVWTFDLESENHAWNAGRPCPHRHSGESRNLTGTPCQRRGSGLRRNDEGAAILPMLAREGRGGAEQARLRQGNQIDRDGGQEILKAPLGAEAFGKARPHQTNE